MSGVGGGTCAPGSSIMWSWKATSARAEVWADLNEVLGMTWEHASGARMALARVAIDSGDGATTDAVYAWVRQAGHGQVIAIKGVAGFDRSTPSMAPPMSKPPKAVANCAAGSGSGKWPGPCSRPRLIASCAWRLRPMRNGRPGPTGLRASSISRKGLRPNG